MFDNNTDVLSHSPKKMGSPAMQKEQHQNAALDEALKESFPASDPVAIKVEKVGSVLCILLRRRSHE